MLFNQKNIFKLLDSIIFKKFIDYNFFFNNNFYKLINSINENIYLNFNKNSEKNKFNETNQINNFNFFFFKLLNINNFNIKTYIFFINNFKKFNFNYNIFLYDLLFRFPKLSYFRTESLNNIFLKKYTNNLNNIFLHLTTSSGISSNFNNIFKRLHYLTVGNFKYLPESCTISGYYSPIIVNYNDDLFFLPDSEFTNLDNFKYITNYYNNNYFNFKLKTSIIFPQKVPNININMLFFFFNKNNLNYFLNNIFFKNYNIYLNNTENLDIFNFFNLSWEEEDNKNFLKKKKIPYINLKTKNKYLLKFHRLNTNTLYNKKYRSHRLSNFFYRIGKNKDLSHIKLIKNELILTIFLIRINFAFNLEDSEFLIDNGYVFINNKVCYNRFFSLKVLDKIQLINNFHNYTVFRNFLSENLIKRSRLWYTMHKIKLSLDKIYKTQQNLEKKWISKLFWNLFDIPKYVEVDFQIYTAILLYKPFSTLDIYPFFITTPIKNTFKMLNWNYLI